jgi:hypothetical protein
VFVKSDDMVEAGDPLVRLENHDLEQEWQKTIGQISETTKRLDSLRQARRNSRNLTEAQLSQVSAEYLQLLQREQNLELQKKLIEEKRSKLIVRSPQDGQVLLPWDADQSLKHRPVVTGQRVMTIANPSGPWELELAMPERRMGHVTKAIEDPDLGPELEVRYVSAGDPRSPKKGTLRKVYGITQVKGEEGPTVKMLVDINPDDLFKPSPGTTVTAKIRCGRSSLGYSWFHEALEWIQKHILF